MIADFNDDEEVMFKCESDPYYSNGPLASRLVLCFISVTEVK